MKSLTVAEYANLWNRFDLSTYWNIPKVKKQKWDIKELLGFNYAMSTPDKEEMPTLHFFLDDHEFERVWNYPKKYEKLLGRSNGSFTPDFSLYSDYPLAVQLFNTFRNRMCGAYWQEIGLNVVPTIGWSEEESFDFCFSGVEKGAIVAIATRGVMKEGSEVREAFKKGYREMMRVIEPELIYCYGTDPRKIGLEGNVVHFKYDSHF